jgi:hypothetical protein
MTYKTEWIRTQGRASTGGASSGLCLDVALLVLLLWLVVFSITLTSQAARLLLDRDPARVPEQLDRLEAMTSGALRQLRSLIAQLRPPLSQ